MSSSMHSRADHRMYGLNCSMFLSSVMQCFGRQLKRFRKFDSLVCGSIFWIDSRYQMLSLFSTKQQSIASSGGSYRSMTLSQSSSFKSIELFSSCWQDSGKQVLPLKSTGSRQPVARVFCEGYRICSISKRTQPIDHTSCAQSYCFCNRIISGARYHREPTWSEIDLCFYSKLYAIFCILM